MMASDLKSFLTLLYKESFKQCRIKSLMFCYYLAPFGPFQYVCSQKNCYKKVPFKPWKNLLCASINQELVRKYLAQELGRPVQNILTIPIVCKQYLSQKGSTYLFVEFFPSKNSQALFKFYQFFLPLITQCIDKLLLAEHLQSNSELLYSTFNHLKEPLAVFDKNHCLSRSNKMFDRIPFLQSLVKNKPTDRQSVTNKSFNKKELHLSKYNKQNNSVLHWKNKVYEKHCYSTYIQGVAYTIYHYVDITESLNLQSQMIQSKKMSSLGKWGENIAHKLNNPLTGILSMAQLMMCSDDVPREVKKDMKDIIMVVNRSQKIIAQLLAFSRPESQLYKCNLNTVLKDTIPFLKSITYLVDFKVHTASDTLFVKAQVCLLQQVVFNLVKNACQAVSLHSYVKAKPSVKVELRRKNNNAVLKVEDNGPGVTGTHVFKPFFTTKAKDQGTGLGLSVSKNIVEHFGGTLEVSHSYMGGACFTLTLPLNSCL